MLKYADFLQTLLSIGGGIIRNVPAVEATLGAAIDVMKTTDQNNARSALASIRDDNDNGHFTVQLALRQAQGK